MDDEKITTDPTMRETRMLADIVLLESKCDYLRSALDRIASIVPSDDVRLYGLTGEEAGEIYDIATVTLEETKHDRD